MSQPIPRQFAGAWLVWIDRHQIRALHRPTLRPAAALNEVFVQEFDPATPDAWLKACESVLRQIRPRWPTSVQFALPQSMTPCFDVALEGGKARPAVVQAYLKARFEQVHGQSSEGWRIRCDPAVNNGKAIAFACRESTVRGLQALGTGTGRLVIVPAVCWGAQRAQRLLRAISTASASVGYSGWYVHVESDRQVALWIDGGAATHVALLPASVGSEQQIPEQLAHWEARLELSLQEAPILVAEPTVAPFERLTAHGRKVLRFGLFDAAQKGAPVGGAQPGGQAWA